MPPFLRRFELDQVSFWLGFLAAILSVWLLRLARPAFSRLIENLRQRSRAAREDLMSGVEVRHGNETVRLAQGMHLASPLFSLDEILLLPRVLAPPPALEPGVPLPTPDFAEGVLPYLPEWPEMGAIYGTPTLTLAEALQGECNLLLYGAPGSGRTVTLAHLATQAARKEFDSPALEGRIPFLILAADLALPPEDPEDFLDPLIMAVACHASRLTIPRLQKFIATTFADGRALLLVDGLDELPLEAAHAASAYIADLLKRFPQTRCVATAAPGSCLPLAELGFASVWMAAWNLSQRREFTRRWSDLWARLVEPPLPQRAAAAGEEPARQKVDAMILNGWLLTDTRQYSPLELTLKVWGAYAGDLPGPSALDGLEAYVRRMTLPASGATAQESAALREAAANLAASAILAAQPFPNRKEAEAWISDNQLSLPVEQLDEAPEAQPEEKGRKSGEPAVPASAGQRLLATWLHSGFISELDGKRLGFSHPEVAAYLAGPRLAASRQDAGLLDSPAWSGRDLALAYAAACGGSWVLNQIPPTGEDPLYARLLASARWLRRAPEKISWRPGVMRQIVACLQNESLTLTLRAAMAAAAVSSGTGGMGVVFRSALHSADETLRRLGALGCGALGGAQAEARTINELTTLLGDPVSEVREAACLALAATGVTAALETLGAALLGADDPLRRAAAQALANHPSEGHPMLMDGAALEDTAVRRAVVFGLSRIRQPWAVDLLRKLLEDPQWVVQSAADQALGELEKPDAHIPLPVPPIHNLPWLIAFAGQRGMGVAPGRPAQELLMRALDEGEEEQRIAAMQVVSRLAQEPAVMPIYRTYFGERDRLQEAAFLSLETLSAAGVPLPNPAQFDFR